MAVSGHSSLAQVQVYIDESEQDRMAEAAMEKLEAKKRTGSDYIYSGVTRTYLKIPDCCRSAINEE